MSLTDAQIRQVMILPAPNGDPCPVGIIGAHVVPVTDERLMPLIMCAPALYSIAASALKIIEEMAKALDTSGKLKQANEYQRAADEIQFLLKTARNEK